MYSGSGLKGYGNLIIVKHNAEYLSAYGFNSRLLAKEGEQVKRGQRVAEQEFATNEEYCRNYRRDFFIGYEFSMPKINPGDYVLKLTVTDLNSLKIGQSSIEFSIDNSDT